jgi:hypothetical protein
MPGEQRQVGERLDAAHQRRPAGQAAPAHQHRGVRRNRLAAGQSVHHSRLLARDEPSRHRRERHGDGVEPPGGAFGDRLRRRAVEDEM